MSAQEVDSANIEAVWASLDLTGFSTQAGPVPVLPKHVINEGSTTQAKGRRSWFESPPTKTLDIARVPTPEKPGQRHGRASDEDDMEVLTLTHFTNPPRIDFGRIKPGVTRRRQLLVNNPHDHDQQVLVERVPTKKNFSTDFTEFVVEAERSVVLTIAWQPVEEGPYREMFLFLIDGVYRLQAIVFGNVIAPAQKRSGKKGLLGSRVKKPFSVLHTENFSNIKQSYTRRRSGSKRNVVLTGYNRQTSNSNIGRENVSPYSNVCADVTSGADENTPGKSASSKHAAEAQWSNRGGSSVRRSVTYTKIGLTADTPDRTTLLSDLSSDCVTLQNNPTSDTNFTSLDEGRTLTKPADDNSLTHIVNKLDFSQVDGSPIPHVNHSKHVETPPSKLTHQPQVSSHVSPNTFVHENFAAISTPDQTRVIEQEMTTRFLKSSERSCELIHHQSAVAHSGENGSQISLGETITFHSTTHTFTENTVSVATPKLNRSLGFRSQVDVSPMSFFRESLSNTPDNLTVPAVTDKIPSPGSVLNNSVPHDIIVRQLGFVRKSLTGGELPPPGWKTSPMVAGSEFPIISKGKPAAEKNKVVAKTAVAKTKARRRSGTKCSNQKKLFSEIPDTCTQSPRRSTFLIKKTKAEKTSSNVNRFQKAGSKVIGKVMSAVNKTKPKRKSLEVKKPPALKFSPHKDSPGVVDTPLEMPDELNPSRLTMVVRKPKVLVSAESKKGNSTEGGFIVKAGQVGKSCLKSPVGRLTSSVDSTTITKVGKSCLKSTVNKSTSSVDSTTVTKVGKSCLKSPVNKLASSVDSTTVTKAKPVVLDKEGITTGKKTTVSNISTETNSKELFPVSPVAKSSDEGILDTDFGSPQPLPTSPQPVTTRRGTLTITKHKPSEALMKSALSAKNLFEKSLNSPKSGLSVSFCNSTPIREGTEGCNKLDATPNRNVSKDKTDFHDSTFDRSDGLSKISLEYVCSSDSSPSVDDSADVPVVLCAGDKSWQATIAALKSEEIIKVTSPNKTSLATENSDSPSKPVTTPAKASSPEVEKATSVEQAVNVTENSSAPDEVMKVSPSTDREDEVKKVSLSIDREHEVKKVSPSIDREDEVKKVSPSIDREDEVKKVSPSIDREDEVKKVSPSIDREDEVKKVSPSIDREERFVTLSYNLLQNTPIRCARGIRNGSEKQKVLRRQIALTDIEAQQQNVSQNAGNTRPLQKKRYHSDSSTVLIRGQTERLEKRQKISDPSAPTIPKTRTRRATDSSVKSGQQRDKQKFCGRPGLAQSRLVLIKQSHTALPKHPMPFAAKNMYYDERWIEKQERGFVKWLNFILTPPEEYQSTTEKAKVDAGSVNLDPKTQAVRLAPTKEVLSLRAYAARRRMNRLRRAACRLYQSDDVVRIIRRLESEVEGYRMAVRRDRMVHADVGLKQKLLDMILSYNSLWLRIGIETIFGEIIPLQSNSDVIGLSRFILTRLLGNPDIAMEFSHPTVPHLYRDGYQEAVNKHILKKFLLLVFFLDVSKKARLMDHDPCLFCKDAEWKSSKELLFQFSKDYLSGEGDITRHLGFLGYTVTHVQLPLDEFDYAVTNLAKDLRDGLRLTRVIELLTHTWDLCRRLRVPAISRLQKVHNLEMTFKSLTQYSHISDPTDGGKVSPRDIVDGHREKTLALLWNIIFNFQVDVLINEAKLREEVEMLTRCLRVRKDWNTVMTGLNTGADSPWEKDNRTDVQICQKSEKLRLLLEWTRAVCAFYSLKIENFTVSFSDGRAFCYLVHHYYPGLLPLSDIQSETSMMYQDQSQDLDDSFSSPMIQQIGSDSGQMAVYEKLLANEKENFRLLFEKVSELGGIPLMLKSTDMSNTIPDERVVVTYLAHLCARLLDVQEEMRAARVIQTAWRRRRIQQQRSQNEVMAKAATVIQKKVRKYLITLRAKRAEAAAVKIQSLWRTHRARVVLTRLRWEKENQDKLYAVQVLQRATRLYLARCRMAKRRRCILRLQAHVRGHLVRGQVRRLKAARKIQTFYRNLCLTRHYRPEFIRKRNAVICLQSAFRQSREYRRQSRAATVIQAQWKCFVQRKTYEKMREATIYIQGHFRMAMARTRFVTLRCHAVVIQRRYRAMVAMENQRKMFTTMKTSAVLIQATWLGFQQQQKYQRLRRSAVVVQTSFRGYKARIKFLALRLATVIVQRRFRAQLDMKCCRQEYLNLKIRRDEAARVIQRYEKARQVRSAYLKQRRSTVVIQSFFRGFLARKQIRAQKTAAAILQRAFRLHRERRCAHDSLRRRSAVAIQATWKMHQARVNYLQVKRATRTIQAAFKALLWRRKFIAIRQAAVTIQCHYRAFRLGETVRLEIDIMIGAAVTIQSAWKRYKARKRYCALQVSAVTVQAMWRAQLQRRKFVRLQIAAIQLQRFYRSFSLTKQVRTEYCQLRSAAVRLQRAWRGRQLLMRLVVKMQALRRGATQRNRFVKQRCAAVVIQKQFRAYQFSKQAKLHRVAQVKAATRIQSSWKGYVIRMEYDKKKKAAICLQANFRCYWERLQFLKLKVAVVSMQACYRARCASRKERIRYLQIVDAAVKIQSFYRAYKCREVFQQKLAAVCLIQTRLRAVLQQRRKRRAAIVLQRAYRAQLAMKEARQQFLQMKTAAVSLQTAWRKYQARKSAQRIARLIKVQSLVRGYIQRKTYVRQRSACVLLQANWRRYMCCKRFHELRKAALCLQRVYRANKAGDEQRLLFLKQRNSVIQLQAAARGFLARKSLQQQQKAAILIQTCFRTFSLRRRYLCKRNAVVVVQQWYRGHREVRLAQKYFREKKLSAVKIQAFYKGYRQRRDFVALRKSTVIIQSRLKGVLQRQQYLRIREAVLRLQHRVRANQLMRKERRDFCRLKTATLKIQTTYRGYLARKSVQRIFAARCIQAAWRGYQDKKCFLKQKAAATRIQACFRGHTVKSRYQKLWWASMVIKRQWLAVRLEREKECMVREQRHREEIFKATILIQKWYRQTREANQLRKQFVNLRTAVIDLQRYVRGFLVRQQLRKMKAAIVIQSYFRMKRERQCYLCHRRAAITIQSYIRGFNSRIQREKRQLAVTVLQRNIRAYVFCSRVRKAANLRDLSARRIQIWYRNCLNRRYNCRVDAATRIQSVYRGHVQRRRYLRLRRAVLLVQRQFRRLQALRAYQFLIKMYEDHRQAVVAEFILRARRELCVLRIQRCYRRYQQLQTARRHVQRVVFLQRWVRSRLDRLRYLRMVDSVRLLQARVRRWRMRRHRAAVTIQRAVREWRERRQLQKREHAATIFQALWRGYHTRRRNSKRLKLMRRRVQEANNAATDDKRLGQRTTSALDYLLRYKQLAYILEALMHLEVVTRLSSECCLRIVEAGAVGVVYTLIRSCNRSLPHMELIKYSISILLNLAKYDRTVEAVYREEDSVSTLVDLMQIYREKGFIFSKACTLLGILGLGPARRPEILQDTKIVDKIRSIHCLTARKQKIDDVRLVTKNKLLAARTSFNSTLPFSTPTRRAPKVRPDWLLHRDSLKDIENPLSAINFVMDALHILPKGAK